MRHDVSLGTALVMALLGLAPALAAQQPADSIDLRRIFLAADSVNGAPVVDTLPRLLQCPQFDARKVRGDASTFSFQRRPVVDPDAPPVTVTIAFVVGVDGRIEPRTAHVVRTTDNQLNQSFEYWVMDCRFRAGKIRGHAVRVSMQRQWEIRPIP
jgi:hypothetical protein